MNDFSSIEDIPGVEYVFFDIFDTIITRTVHPEYVKRLAAKRLCVGAGLNLDPEVAYRARVGVELLLRKENEHKGHDPEYDFLAFCRTFYEELKKLDPAGIGGFTEEEFVPLCCSIELEVEKSVQRVDPACMDAIGRLKRRGIPVSCISDFYLPGRMMRELFVHHGIDGVFDNIFVSSDYLAAKWSGKLYDLVLSATGQHPGKVLMVGDSEHSDYRIALSKGMRAWLVDRGKERSEYNLFLKSALDVSRTAGRVDSRYRQSERSLGKRLFCEMTFPLFLFTQKLYSRLANEKVEDVFFLSKEGEFLRRLFDLYQDSQGLPRETRIRSHYLVASRRSTFIPSLGPLPEEDFHNLFRQYKDTSPGEFLQSLNFSRAETEEVLRETGTGDCPRITDFHRSKVFEDIKSCPAFSAVYERKRNSQREDFGKYMDSFGVDFRARGFHLVDVGWKGTIQDNISLFFKGEVAVKGYYLGLTEYGSMDGNNRKEGILFSIAGGKTDFYRTYNENKQLFEMVLGASHGSARSYEAANGEARAVVEDIGEEHALFVKHIKPMQESIEERFLILCGLFKEVHFAPAAFEEYFARKLARLMFLPTRKEMDFFQGLYHYQNFGLFEFTRFDDPQLSLNERVRNLLVLCKEPYWTMARGCWGPLTLRRMGLSPLRFPYAMYRYCQLYFRKK